MLYRGQAITKLGLARYYEAVADWMVPHVSDRPLSLVRCPEGDRGACFYQKHAAPASRSRSSASASARAVAARRPTSTWTTCRASSRWPRSGVLEIHPWGTRVERLERPDRLVIDLDPAPGLPWARVVEAAGEARALFEDLDLVSFVKTTGGKGLHVVVPLRPEAGWDALRALGEGIGAEMTRRAPDRYTVNPLKAARRGRIFIDYLRNVRGATAVAAYSPRAKPGAPVSTPLAWAELSARTDPVAFTVADPAEAPRHPPPGPVGRFLLRGPGDHGSDRHGAGITGRAATSSSTEWPCTLPSWAQLIIRSPFRRTCHSTNASRSAPAVK